MKVLAKDFNLEATLESGQVFGFKKNSTGSYEGAIGGKRFSFNKIGESLSIETEVDGAESIARHFFDLDRDLTPIYALLETDAGLQPAYKTYKGLRLIRQDAWEALLGFILSSNNNVKRIQLIWQNLIRHYKGVPTASQIARTHERMLKQLGLGYRARFLLHTALFVASNPECLQVIREASYEEAHARALSFPGIGPKVADCVLLYGFQKYEAFPVDVWIRRIMKKLYFKNRNVSEERIHAFAQKRWGKNAGYVQQYLFHGAKTGVLI